MKEREKERERVCDIFGVTELGKVCEFTLKTKK